MTPPISPTIPRPQDPTPASISEFSPEKLIATLLEDQEHFSNYLGKAQVAELGHLAKETDPQLFFEALYNFTLRLEQKDRFKPAILAYQMIQSHDWSGNFRDKAEKRLALLRGEGSVGERFEIFGKRFLEKSIDPINLFSYGIGGIAFHGTRGLLLAKLATTGWARPLVLLASYASVLVEVPVNWAARKGIQELLNPGQQPWNKESRRDELLTLALTLGGARVLRSLGTGIGERFFGNSLRVKKISAISGTLAGIALFQPNPSGIPYQPDRHASDTLATAFAFFVGDSLARAAVGGRFATIP